MIKANCRAQTSVKHYLLGRGVVVVGLVVVGGTVVVGSVVVWGVVVGGTVVVVVWGVVVPSVVGAPAVLVVTATGYVDTKA